MTLDNLHPHAPRRPGAWRFWIDRGGTFTDIVAINPDGDINTVKILSDSPFQSDDAVLLGLRHFLGEPPHGAARREDIADIKMGTTVATNALLERRGSPVAFVTTAGFSDALRIGHQHRPHLFALQIRLPEPLYAEVFEAHERLSAAGEILQALDVDALRDALQQARDRGCRACAVSFMHAYRNGVHELMAQQIARDLGFEHVSISHQVSPLIRYISRSETTVVDAYLSPVLRRYVDGLGRRLGTTPLMFMQSSGGLTTAERFRGKDAVLSGPAGGVIGAVESAREVGIDRVIGFDMGGTSTDVSHYAGQYERVAEAQIAGVRLRTPMMQVHTVAAGGGSVLSFDGQRLRVGPESAGAVPGPASYGRGGPLTVTDANLLLGRIDARYFPQVFGMNGQQSLDLAHVRTLFDALAGEVGDRLGQRWSAEDLAEGFLRIADETMALAIKQISVQRGHELAGYTLCAFGGAGGQHATRLADALEMPQVLLHPMAGVLSALGIGLADLSELRESAIEQPLDAPLIATLAARADQLSAQLGAQLGGVGADAEAPQMQTQARLRYAGSDSTLECTLPMSGDEDCRARALRADFERQHRQRYGFTAPDKPIMVESVAVEAICRMPRPALPKLAPRTGGAVAADDYTRMYVSGRWQRIPVYCRRDLRAQDVIDGPALVAESTGTIVIDAGWRGEVQERGDLILRRGTVTAEMQATGLAAAPVDPSRPDPMRLELFGQLFMSIAQRMGATLENTSHSVNIKERLDFSCAVFDADGQLIANAPHMPVHLGSMGDSVRAIRDRHHAQLAPGQSYALNAPYNGGTHLPDITVVTPVFMSAGSVPDFWVASRGHHADVGGITPGSMPPNSTSIEQEGVVLEGLLIVSDGSFREQDLRQCFAAPPYPARNIDQNLADLKAQVAANRCGEDELRKTVERYGLDLVRNYMAHVQNQAERSVRQAIRQLHGGQFRYLMDDGAAIQVQVTIDAASGSAQVDFAGTSAQRPNNFNAPASVCKAAVLYVFRSLIQADIPLNDGCLRPIALCIPPGSMLNPVYPAAVVAGNVETSQCIVDCLYGALGIVAAAQGTMNNLTFGDERYQYYETLCGGSGAGPGWHGTDAVHTHMTNSRLTDPEILESRFPVRLEHFHIRRDSGGSGRWHGGNGVVRRLRFLAPMQAGVIANRRQVPPFGLAGGGSGACGQDRILRHNGQIEPLPPGASVALDSGDALEIATPGGGGYGSIGN